MVTGSAADIGKALTASPTVRKLSFTGSTEVGRQLMAECAENVKRVSLELGGNAPFIVFDDADIEQAVQGAMISKYRKSGQTCVCANRVFVQEGVYELFSQRLVKAVEALKGAAYAKFDESVEFAARLNVDPKKADQQVRGTVVLPNGTGKTVRILVLTRGEKEKEAQDAGADHVGSDEYINKIKQGWTEFDVAIATPDVMSEVGKLGKILGPRGLMPNPKSGTVTMDVERAVGDVKAGKIEFRVDKTGNLHAPIGKVSFSHDRLSENLGAFMDAVVRAKPSAAKGTYVRSVTVSSTMGPGVHVDPAVYR